MPFFVKIIIDGGILSVVASIWLIFTMKVNARIYLQDYPPKIQEQVPRKTNLEKQLTYIFGIPFILILLFGSSLSTFALTEQGDVQFLVLWLNAAGVFFVFNLIDWLILDWLIFCTLTPNFLVIPGSEGMAEYKNYGYHFRAFLRGNIFSILGGLIIAGLIFIL